MTINLNIAVGGTDELVATLLNLAGHLGASLPSSAEPVVTPAEPVAAAPASRRGGRRAAPTIEGTATVVSETPATPAKDAEKALTVDEAREAMKKFAADGHMDQVEKALEAFGVKRVSDVDPDAKGKPSPKFAAFVAKIDELVAAKAA